MANQASYFKNAYIKNNLPGDLWLREHFRCAHPIIEFCNKYVYDDYMLIRSISNTPTLHLYLMPHEFESKKEESGQINIAEAEMIVGKILAQLEEDKKNGLDILEKSKTIGIITPYAAQEKVLLRALKKANLQGIAAGTVNKFQGSERKTIFFSSTIGINDTNAGSLNFNKNDISIINVAVSRAKEKFILVGNTQNLTSSTSSYTGLLVEHMNKYK